MNNAALYSGLVSSLVSHSAHGEQMVYNAGPLYETADKVDGCLDKPASLSFLACITMRA